MTDSGHPDSIASVVADLWLTIGDETPDLATRLRRVLADTPVGVHALADDFTLTAHGVSAADPRVEVVVTAGAPSIEALITGRIDLAGAVTTMTDFDVRGPAAAIAAAEQVLHMLVLGAVRSAHADAIYSRVMTLCAGAEAKGRG